MPRVIVHWLAGRKKALDACRLIQRLYLAGQRVVVWLADERRARMFNDYLWEFEDESFVPHAFADQGRSTDEPVVVTTGELGSFPGGAALVLLDPPEDLGPLTKFARVHDFVLPALGEASRVAAWRNAGFEVTEVRGVDTFP